MMTNYKLDIIFITESVDDDEDLFLPLQELFINVLGVLSDSAGIFSPEQLVKG